MDRSSSCRQMSREGKRGHSAGLAVFNHSSKSLQTPPSSSSSTVSPSSLERYVLTVKESSLGGKDRWDRSRRSNMRRAARESRRLQPSFRSDSVSSCTRSCQIGSVGLKPCVFMSFSLLLASLSFPMDHFLLVFVVVCVACRS